MLYERLFLFKSGKIGDTIFCCQALKATPAIKQNGDCANYKG